MSKKAGVIFMSMGAVLTLLALLLFLYNTAADDRAGQRAAELLEGVKLKISTRTEGTGAEPTEAVSGKPEENGLSEPTVVEVNGCGYIGYLAIPAFGLELPVMSEWDYERLKIAPCRQFGSAKTDDLVIAAHNYKRHFALLSSLTAGERVNFTDMDGEVHAYAVINVNILPPTAVDLVQNSGYDLVLYTCTYGGATRIVVFCDRAEDILEENRS